MTQLRIHLLRLPGIEAAGKTGKLPLPDTAVQILCRTSIGSPAQGELAAKLTEGSLFPQAHLGCTDTVIAVSRCRNIAGNRNVSCNVKLC